MCEAERGTPMLSFDSQSGSQRSEKFLHACVTKAVARGYCCISVASFNYSEEFVSARTSCAETQVLLASPASIAEELLGVRRRERASA